MKRTVFPAAIVRSLAAVAVLAGLALTALPGSAMATRTATPLPLVVFTDGTSTLGQAALPAGASFDFTWTKNGCANGYQDPAIVALATKHGNLLTSKGKDGEPVTERPWVLPCVKGPKTKPLSVRKHTLIIDIKISRNGVCITINGRSYGCDIWLNTTSVLESHVWLFGGNTVDKGFIFPKGSSKSGQAVSVPRGATHLDFYPGGSAIPYISNAATTPPPTTNPGPLYFRRLEVHNLGSSGQDGVSVDLGKRFIPSGNGADVIWTEKSCASGSETPLKFVEASARPDPTRNVFMLSHLYQVPCISQLHSGTRKNIDVTVDVTITFRPFRVRPTIDLGLTGDTLLEDASVSAASVFSYGGVFSASAVCADGAMTCAKTKPTPKSTTSASYDLAVAKK